MGFSLRLILLSSICPLVFFSAMFLLNFISFDLYLLFFFSTVSICCCLLAFNLCDKQRAATLLIHTSSSLITNTEVTPPPPPSSSSSSPPSSKLTYDVFLSFRGTDTRTNFTDHLYTALNQKGIFTFRDDEELRRGESIGPNLLKAIEESRYVIVVFSRNYAGSAWCLDEIAKVSDCMKEVGQKVLPVFYHVDPSEVRRQTGDHFGKAFAKHQERYKSEPERVKGWRDALLQVGNLSGWHLQDGYESKIIQEIVEKVFTELNKIISSSEGLVGMDSHLNELLSFLDIGCHNDVRIIGICGMGGIGKTTIAQVVFERLKAQFEGDSFLENVKQETVKQGSSIHLQEKLLSNLLNSNVNVQNTKMGKDIIKHRLSTKRVLIVLDDVDQDIQLETLCHRTWFGPGSRIIITSRDEHLITAFGADKVYQVNALSDPDAFELFRLKAFFNQDEVGEDFLKLSREFLEYANGLPLAIKVLGSSVRCRSINFWSSTLKRLKKNPPKRIIDVLKVSFDGLEETEKKMFLDIACFFKGHNKDRVIRILDACDDEGVKMDVEVLQEKSLVSLFGTNLGMHDLIQEMGWEVVLQECREEPGKRSRLWLPNEIIHVLGRCKATSAVQSIFLKCAPGDDVVSSIDNAFSNMDRLRLLKISNVKFSGNITYLSNDLQYLEWHYCPLDSFPSDFHPEKLVEVHMLFSRIKQLWRGKQGWSVLRHLDLSSSSNLISTPDFCDVPDLEVLTLKHCSSLVEVHPSLGFLRKLRSLDLQSCVSIQSLPPFITLESLQILSLSFCSGLKKFPEIKGNMKTLLELYLDGTSIEELSPSTERLTGLTKLNLINCKNLQSLPNTRCLSSLQSLDLTGCSQIDEVPENMKGMKCLKQLLIGGTSIRELSFIRGMTNLRYLSCRGCKCLVPESFKGLASSSLIGLDLSYCNLRDGEILNDFSSLISLKLLHLSGNCFVQLPENISQLSELTNLYLRDCRQLQLLPKDLPVSLRSLDAKGCTSLIDYPNQIAIRNATLIDSLNDSAFDDSDMITGYVYPRNEGESIQRCLTYTDTEGKRVNKYLPMTALALQEECKMDFFILSHGVAPTDELPEWYSTRSTRNSISISIPENLANDNKWKGVAYCAIVAVKGHTEFSLIEPDPGFLNYSYQVTFETDVLRLKPFPMLRSHLDGFGLTSHLRLFFYVPSSYFPERELDKSTVLRAVFETTNPSMVVQECGIHLAYEQDAGLFEGNIEGPICLDKVKDSISVFQCGWLSQSWEWEKFIPPLEKESTLLLRKNLESVLPRNLEATNSCVIFEFNLRGSPASFQTFAPPVKGTHFAQMSITGLPQNLYKNKKWIGFAICLSLVEEVGQTRKQDNYQASITLQNGDDQCNTVAVSLELEHIRPLSKERHQLLVIYLPRAVIAKEQHSQTLTTAMGLSIRIDSPHVEVQRCGFQNLYQKDIQGFADTIIRCMQRDNSLKSYDKWVVEAWIRLIRWEGAHLKRMTERDSRTPREKYFEMHSPKYRNWDWSKPRIVSCFFGAVQISKFKWFVPFINQGNSAEIQLPLNVFDDGNWLGFAICCQISTHYQNPNISLDSTAAESTSGVLNYRLDSDVAWHGLFDCWMHHGFEVLEPLDYHATRFSYIPRTEVFYKMWKQCKLARITMWPSNQSLGVDSCALRLLYKEDIEHLVETLTLAELP